MHAAPELSDGESAPVLRLVDKNSPAAADSARVGIVAVYETEFHGLARLAYLLCGSTQQADDLAHDAFVRLYEHWDRVNDPTKRRAYLRTILVNLVNSAHRRNFTVRRHAAAPLLTADPAATSAEDEAIWRSARPEVLTALSTLSERQRTAVVLRHWLNMTESEIAEAMGCSVGAVRTHIARGHQNLATRLEGVR